MTTMVASAPAHPWAGFPWTKRGEDGRTHEPIHWGSRPSLGEHEPTRRITPKQREGWLHAFDRHAKAARPNGVRRGARIKGAAKDGPKFHCFSHAARQVLAYFLDLAVNTGRICPSYDHIARVLDIPRSLVARVLDQLEQFGWIVRERRFRRNAKPEGEPGPKLEQDTNWYHVQLPPAAAALLKAWQRRDLEQEAAAAPDPARAAEKARAASRARLERQVRGLEQNLRQVQAYYERAHSDRDRRRFATAEADLQASISALLSRLALLSEAASDARVGHHWESYGGGESPSGNNQTKTLGPKRP